MPLRDFREVKANGAVVPFRSRHRRQPGGGVIGNQVPRAAPPVEHIEIDCEVISYDAGRGEWSAGFVRGDQRCLAVAANGALEGITEAELKRRAIKKCKIMLESMGRGTYRIIEIKRTDGTKVSESRAHREE